MAENDCFVSPCPICFFPYCTVLSSTSTMVFSNSYQRHPRLVPIPNRLLAENVTGNKMNLPIHTHPPPSISTTYTILYTEDPLFHPIVFVNNLLQHKPYIPLLD